MTDGKAPDPLLDSKAHTTACHERWLPLRDRKMEDPDYRDEWYRQQCGSCRHWIALDGALGEDWGACSNPQSRFDASVRFEHDGCDVYERGDAWA